MGVDKFKFVSPGIFLDEIDESGIPALPERMGPLIIGRFAKGPANRPVKVESFREFVSLFGYPSAGNASGDIWRTGDLTAPTYAAYAAQAWLRNNSPCTIIRLLGDDSANAQDSAVAKAGWKTAKGFNEAIASAGGAYGLVVIPSASAEVPVTGTLAATWYVEGGAVVLEGTVRDEHPTAISCTTTGSAGVWIESRGKVQFTARILNSSNAVEKKATFNFDRDSTSFVRKVFNTDPTKTNSDIFSSTNGYWLGETYESNLTNAENSKLSTGALNSPPVADASNFFGMIVAMEGGSNNLTWHNHQQQAKAASTGWFFSQDNRGGLVTDFDPGSHTDKLFKIVALGGAGRNQDPGSGEVGNREHKISIQDIKPPTDKFNQYGTFTVLVRDASDTDNRPRVLERFSGVDLNPTSPKYIGRVIGDKYYDFDATNNVVREFGENDNRSKYVRADLSDLVKDGGAEGLLPFGVYGPVVPASFELQSGSAHAVASFFESSGSIPFETLYVSASHATTAAGIADAASGLSWTRNDMTAKIVFPTPRLRVSSSEGDLVKATKAYWGYQSNIKGTKRFDKTNLDLLRGMPSELDPHTSSSFSQYAWKFTLEDLKQSPDDVSHAVYVEGSRAANVGWSAESGAFHVLTGSDAGFDRFTSPMFGGFDGLDVTEPDPFRNTYMGASSTMNNNSTYYSLKKAIDMASDKDYLEFDLAAMPGITNTSLNTQLINACEERADALAVIDLEGNYKPPHENDSSEVDNLGSVTDVVNTFDDMAINSSYGCTFYPYVKIRDSFSDSMLYVPPSVVALGTFSSAQRKSAVWFAPAGFTRGGLSEGSAGLPVVGVRQRLSSDDRDKLYDANINPIAQFPAEGIVIFGQKTLQVTPSALDRINVRRLLIFLKKEISRIASRILFDQNIQSTWDRFKGQVVPLLEGVQAGQGLTDFKVVLDASTTTPDLIDRNIMYAKIFLKPARAIEFIALDFIITRSGASFDD